MLCLRASIGGQILSIFISMRARDFIAEGDVIQNKFGMKQQQKGKDKYKYNEKIAKDIPMYDPRSGTGILPSHTGSGARGLEPFKRFEVVDVNANVARMYGVTQDDLTVYLSAGQNSLIHALADTYNRGGFTDMDLEKIDLGPEDDQ